MKTTHPTQSLLQGGPYTPAVMTDIRRTFERIRNRGELEQVNTADLPDKVVVMRGHMAPIKTQPTLIERLWNSIKGTE